MRTAGSYTGKYHVALNKNSSLSYSLEPLARCCNGEPRLMGPGASMHRHGHDGQSEPHKSGKVSQMGKSKNLQLEPRPSWMAHQIACN